MKKNLPFILFLLSGLHLCAQIGGTKVYEFLNLPQSARVTALGGEVLTIMDDDVALAYTNPAVLNPQMSGAISFSHAFHLADLGHGNLAYAQHIEKWDVTFHGNIQYMNYGDFAGTDEFGNPTTGFSAKEYAFTVGAGKQLYEKLSVGVNLRLISSQLESYNSVGWTGDIGAVYQDTASNFSAALVFANFGSQFTAYDTDRFEGIPYNARVSISKRLRYLPVRFGLTYGYLNRWNILYDDPNQEDVSLFIGEEQTENKFGTRVDNFARHLVFNTELLLGKKENLRLRFGYNHLRKKELSVDNFRSLAGFSLGFGLKINRFRLDFGQAFYHVAGGSGHFTLSTNLAEFTKGKQVVRD